ncbi:MAG: DUF4383 domain-containing protein [Pseudonocardiales bacterium]|nr:DUF4383 domain-containing protein [Pseudonocardiales bacterium]
MTRFRHRGNRDQDRSATAVRINHVHRGGATVLGGFLWAFAILGFVHRLPLLSTSGRVFGLSTNGALSTISLVVGAVLLGSAVRGGRSASTVTTSVGVLFLLSGLVHLAIINTSLNVLSFRLPNVFFSLAAGLLLLGVGAYGRLSGAKPPGNPYRRPPAADTAPHDDPELSDAEQAVAAGTATLEQQRHIHADALQRQTREYDQAWETFVHDHSPEEVTVMRQQEQRESAYPERASDRSNPSN